MANPTVAFNLPSPYQADLDKIAQQQKMAELLQAQSLQPTERYSYKGIEARSPVTAGLAKMLQGFTAMQMQEKGLEEQKALGERYQSDLVSTLNRANELSFGKPAIAEKAPVTQVDDEGYPNPVVAGSPAVAPNPEAAAREYFKHPATQAMGMNQLQKIAQTQQFINAGNAGNAPPNTSVTNAGVTPATSTSGSAVVPQVGSQQLASALTGFGGPAGGQPMRLYLQTDPTGKSYLEQLAKDFTDANKPTDKIRELVAAGVKPGTPQWNAALTNILTAGGIYQPNAEGGVGLAKGFVTGAGDIKRAEEQAKAENEVVTRTVGGREVLGTNRQFKILATGNAPTEAEANEVANWAFNNGLKLSIKFPQTGGMPQGSSGGGAPGQPSSVRNPTSVELKGMEKGAESTMAMIPKELSESLEIAKNAEKRHETIQQIHGAIQSNKAILGPGATAATWLQRVGESAFGPGNKKSMVETQQVIQGLSDLALSGASAMQRQGAITEGERELLVKAKSGVQNLLPSELNALLTIFDKQARNDVLQHNEKMKRAEKVKFQNLEYWGNVPDLPPLGQAKVGTNLSPAAIDFMQKNNIPIPGAK